MSSKRGHEDMTPDESIETITTADAHILDQTEDYEDPLPDEEEEDNIINEGDEDYDDHLPPLEEDLLDSNADIDLPGVKQVTGKISQRNPSSNSNANSSSSSSSDGQNPRVWRPGIDDLEEDEQLDYDPTAYDMLHRMDLDWSCMSFDILSDDLGSGRTKYPMTTYFVAGSQAEQASENSLTVVKTSQLCRTYFNEEDSEADDEDIDVDPSITKRTIPYDSAFNRVRAMPQSCNIVATWSEDGVVNLWDLSVHIAALDGPLTEELINDPIQSFNGHAAEGFAMDWSPTKKGNLVTGDCSKFIYLWKRHDGAWNVDKKPFHGHTDSVEDLQWSPTEKDVFASASCDQTIRIWDVRVKKACVVQFKAHDADVNVIAWNKDQDHMLASGGDDGIVRVWDLNYIEDDKEDPMTFELDWHQTPITSLEWSPHQDSVLLVSSDSPDDQVAIWDFSLEEDNESKPLDSVDIGYDRLPSQLFFVHQGQQSIKEAHWHHQIPGMVISSALDGFSIWKSRNMLEMDNDNEIEMDG